MPSGKSKFKTVVADVRLRLEVAMSALAIATSPNLYHLIDQLQIARLKKKKLVLKDRIMRLEDQLVPDIIA